MTEITCPACSHAFEMEAQSIIPDEQRLMLARKLDVLTLCKVFGWKNTTRALTYYNPTASDIARRLRARP